MNKPLDRDYFKNKANPNAKKGPKLTKCCGQEADRHILNKNNKNDWELIEDYCEENLRYYKSVKSIKPVCCEECGRLIEYISVLNETAWK
jgi:hypothetical protein